MRNILTKISTFLLAGLLFVQCKSPSEAMSNDVSPSTSSNNVTTENVVEASSPTVSTPANDTLSVEVVYGDKPNTPSLEHITQTELKEPHVVYNDDGTTTVYDRENTAYYYALTYSFEQAKTAIHEFIDTQQDSTFSECYNMVVKRGYIKYDMPFYDSPDLEGGLGLDSTFNYTSLDSILDPNTNPQAQADSTRMNGFQEMGLQLIRLNR